ncbi:hypothetical protein HHUSO_G33776 [Huso huso]|uniref:Zn(2)-C6 fungal-type domain-containing protein n=1 Tax=Huso huso TaxID=61971 RepID=A0ABR0Y5V6_HUSHU
MDERKRSIVWSHFTPINCNEAKCDICQKQQRRCLRQKRRQADCSNAADCNSTSKVTISKGNRKDVFEKLV